MKTIKLYHYSNNNIKDKININRFNDNDYTLNDYKASKIKRVFFYSDLKNIEYRFKYYNYLYTVEVNKKKIYNLDIDYLNLKSKSNNIDNLLLYLKKHFIGVFYKIGNLKITVLFKSVKIKNKIQNGGIANE